MPADFLAKDVEFVSENRVAGNQLLGQIEIVTSLALVIGQNEPVAFADHEAIERGEHEVGRFEVLLGPAGHHEVVERHAVRTQRVESPRQQLTTIWFHGVEQRTPVEPL